MKKRLLGGTAIVGVSGLIAGMAGAAEAPTWKLTGNANFQFYWVDQDAAALTTKSTWNGTSEAAVTWAHAEEMTGWAGAATDDGQDHDWYFGVDEAELQLNVSGTADNGLNYGFKIEINANTTDGSVADEVRLQFSGGWGTLQMGDEDGAEDIMNYGGENLMGATGGFDGDQDDYLVRAGGFSTTDGDTGEIHWNPTGPGAYVYWGSDGVNVAAPTYPTIAGDTSDKTKVSYFSPRFSGFQVGASITPTPNNGDDFKEDGSWENHIGLGANYDNSFGDLRIRASVVYSTASSNDTWIEDVSAFSVGGIVGWGPFSLGANYTDNAESGQPKKWDWDTSTYVGSGIETSYWNVAAGFETGPMYFSAGYFASTLEHDIPGWDDSTYEHIALTADYTVAPGLGVYAEINMISDELLGGSRLYSTDETWFSLANDTTSLVVGANISF
ncbi:MAG: porin [Proteobacteria bacterium]|nr:porin [Pseudomonadota bacterium]